MKTLVIGTSHTFGECEPEGHIPPEQRWCNLFTKSIGSDLEVLSMAGASFQHHAYIAMRYLFDTNEKYDLCVVEGRHITSSDGSYPLPKGKGISWPDSRVFEEFDNTHNHALFYKPWLTKESSYQKERLEPFQNMFTSGVPVNKEWYESYVCSPLHFIDCYFINLGLCKFLEKYCSRVAWFSMNGPNKHVKDIDTYIEWSDELLKDYKLECSWSKKPTRKDLYRPDDFRCGCGHPNAKGHVLLADEIEQKLREKEWI